MFRLESRKIQLLTSDLAEQFLLDNVYVGQRPSREWRVKELADAIRQGVFLTGYIALGRQGWNGGKKMMANGQHQCLAVINTDATVSAVIEEYYCKTPADLALLYRQFDNGGTRSLAEVAIPEVRALGLNWSKKFISAFLAGITFLENCQSIHKNQKVEYLERYTSVGKQIYEIVSVNPVLCKHLWRGPVIAAMIKTFRKNAFDAEQFWTDVRDGELLTERSPALKLMRYLLQTTVGIGRGVKAPSLTAAVGYVEMYSKCIIAWNAFRRKNLTSLRYYPNKGTPKIL